ncbi:calmodulin-binding transcription activator 2 isoform X2 [Trichomycterus rosablanca]|uniref:calmodulin-binding transcription activator 2 isoform X2 n=1 Tax=Trichomycterus rosablanca TaxID=2290929 RepID=UPI002F350B8A
MNKDTTTESENNSQMKVFLPNKLLECLPHTSTLPKERLRWNTNEEIASFLISFDRHEEWLSCTLKTRPQNGSIILYNRKKVQYRKDGYCWKKRKDGKTTREDHMKLKVQGTECLYGCYVHSSIVPTFHRRCYWLLQNPDIVLVHYLNVPNVEDSGKVCGPVLCAVSDRRDGLRWSREELLSQLKPMFHSMKWCGTGNGPEPSIEQLVLQILESQQTKPQPRTHTCLCNHASSGMNIPHRCNSTKHRIISPKLPCGPAPYQAEMQNPTNQSSGCGKDGAGDVAMENMSSEKTQPSSPAIGPENCGLAPPSSTSSPPQIQRAATITIGNGNGFYGEQRGGLATMALPQNAVLVMTTAAAAAALGRGGEESKGELGPTHLSLTRAGGRLVLSPVPPKQDTPPASPAPGPAQTAPPNQGVATLSLTLLPSPVIGGLLLTDRINTPGALLRPQSPPLMTAPPVAASSGPDAAPATQLPFDPDSFLNSPKQGQTYGGSSLSPNNASNPASISQTPPPSTSPQAASLALSLSPTSSPSSLSSLSPPTSTPNSSLSFSLSPSCSAPSFPPFCLDSSLALDPLANPLNLTLNAQKFPAQYSQPGCDGHALMIGQNENAPPTPVSLNHLQTTQQLSLNQLPLITNQLSPSQLSSNHLPLITNQLSPSQLSSNQLPLITNQLSPSQLSSNHLPLMTNQLSPSQLSSNHLPLITNQLSPSQLSSNHLPLMTNQLSPSQLSSNHLPLITNQLSPSQLSSNHLPLITNQLSPSQLSSNHLPLMTNQLSPSQLSSNLLPLITNQLSPSQLSSNHLPLMTNQLSPSQLSSNHLPLITNQLSPSQLSSNHLPLMTNQLSPSQLSSNLLPLITNQLSSNQLPADVEGAGHCNETHLLTSHAPAHARLSDLRSPVRGLRHSLSQPALLVHTDTHSPQYSHTPHTHSHTHTPAVQVSPVQVKEEKSPPITSAVLHELEPDEMPMDTAHSSDSAQQGAEEAELTFDSTFPDLISELMTEETSAQTSCSSLNPASTPTPYPVRYMAPPQPTPSTSYLPYSILTNTATHSHMHSGPGEEPQRLASITDFSPEWSYPEGGVKVLITGPWCEVSCRYSCVFDQSTVPASLIQPGVLRCYCPAHEAGLVALRVMKDSEAVSSSVLFEYRARNATSLPSSQLDWLSLDDNQFRMSILERLEQMERRMAEMANNNQQQQPQQQQQRLSRQQSSPPSTLRLTPENQSGVWFERRIVSVCERMMSGGRWGGSERLTHCVRHRGMTLLHLAAAQGYTHLIHTLIRWRTQSSDSLDLEQEVDPLNVDHFSCTPLMWACALGHQSAAVLLYRWSSVALMIPDSLGRLPLAVARSRGHTRLARCLEELHTHTLSQTHTPDVTHTHNNTHTLETSPPPQFPPSPLSTSPDTGLSSSSSVPSPSDPPSPSPSSAYSSGSAPLTSPQSPPDLMDTSCDSSPRSSPPRSSPMPPLPCPTPSVEAHFLVDSPSPPHLEHTHSSFEAELLNYSENAENEEYLPAEVLQVDMATLADQIIEATPERIKQEEFPRGAESPLRERRDNSAIHDTMPWLAPYLDTVDRCVCPTPQPPSPLSALALQRLRPPSSAAWAEFLNASANGRMERDFALLTLTDSEQRELYEAARIIQNAFRRYKGRRLKEQQDIAAAVIQRCYRKYKQYALYKKMTQAAILIQSKFRSYYEQKKFQQSRRAAVLIQQYYRSYKEYERIKQGGRSSAPLSSRIKGSFLTKKQDQAARKIMRFFRRCRHRIKELKQSKELERRGLTT